MLHRKLWFPSWRWNDGTTCSWGNLEKQSTHSAGSGADLLAGNWSPVDSGDSQIILTPVGIGTVKKRCYDYPCECDMGERSESLWEKKVELRASISLPIVEVRPITGEKKLESWRKRAMRPAMAYWRLRMGPATLQSLAVLPHGRHEFALHLEYHKH